jgi:hypothetical protein
MAEESSLRLRIDPEDWLDADVPTVLVVEPDVALLDLDLPVVRVAGWDTAEVDVDPVDWHLTRAAMDRRPPPGDVSGQHSGEEPAI